MDARENIIAFIDSLVKSQVISPADLLKVCGQNGCSVGGNPSFKQITQVVNHLNAVTGISDNNLNNFCWNKGIKIKVRATLRKCLRLRKFRYTQKRGCRTYYVKAGNCPEITAEDIVL